jgi:hypothetical protein
MTKHLWNYNDSNLDANNNHSKNESVTGQKALVSSKELHNGYVSSSQTLYTTFTDSQLVEKYNSFCAMLLFSLKTNLRGKSEWTSWERDSHKSVYGGDCGHDFLDVMLCNLVVL